MDAQVQFGLGTLNGVIVKSRKNPAQQICYHGDIPYALPPTGERRFRRPQPLPAGYRYAGDFKTKGPVCPQPFWLGTRHEEDWGEDCLRLNIYRPVGKPPAGGWPVFFYIHGGWLQFGTANMAPGDLVPLLTETPFQCIIVQPAYRVNAFGFLASQELQAEAQEVGEASGNMGFWDQRMALEWTYQHIQHFRGNPQNITVAGYSAGSHSTFQQLAHELYMEPNKPQMIRRAVMFSNSPGVQPKALWEQQKQFDELLTVLGIDAALPAREKLRRLRATPALALVEAQSRMAISEFRATTDDAFVPARSIAAINTGDFARRMRRRGVQLLNGECADEHNMYRNWRTPAASYDAVHARLCADYPEATVRRLMAHYCHGARALPTGYASWPQLFGRVYADMQVHFLERGFHGKLAAALAPGRDLFKYRIEWKAQCSPYAPEWGVTHATDQAIWFWNPKLAADEKKILAPWIEAFAKFVKGEAQDWGTRALTDSKRLRSDGTIDVMTDDPLWQEGQEVWDLVNGDEIKSRL
jgi:carboxylesterase type B